MPAALSGTMHERTSLGLGVGLAALAVGLTVLAACSSALEAGDSAGGSKDDRSATVPGADGTRPDGKIETATGLPCEVDEILKARCQTCHSSPPKYGASAPLVTWDELQKPGPGASANKKVWELVKERIHDDARPMPPSPQFRLDAKELGALDGWFAAGAKATDAKCVTDKPSDGVKPLSCTPDTVLKAKTPFTMQPGAPLDQYVCFGVNQPLTKKRHVTALAPKVDNAQIVHHILLFQTDKAESAEPFACSSFGSSAWKLVAGWAPGGNNLELPPEAGLPAEKGTTHWVVQIHYNNATAKTGTDQSGYELCTTENLRPNDAGVIAFGSINFDIPPRATHTIKCDYRLGAEFKDVQLFNASPHMHTFGAAMSTERLPGGNGAPEMIFEQKAFSFEAQANYPIKAKVAPNDIIRTRCTWKNPTDATVKFGEGTNDEMCFDFVGYYPNIPDKTLLGYPVFTWVTPSMNASCTAEN